MGCIQYLDWDDSLVTLLSNFSKALSGLFNPNESKSGGGGGGGGGRQLPVRPNATNIANKRHGNRILTGMFIKNLISFVQIQMKNSFLQ